MPDTPPLRPGDPYRCPRCHTAHVIEQPYADRSTAERTHLYIPCRGNRYFVGQAVNGQLQRRLMPDEFLTDDEIEEHLSGVTFNVGGDFLTVRFPSGFEEVWTLAPPGYPLDGSFEVMRVDDRYFIPPARKGDA